MLQNIRFRNYTERQRFNVVQYRSVPTSTPIKTNYMANQTVYGLVQCTRDLIADECTNCVKNYTATADCSDQLGAQIMGPNCYIRYELYSFDVASYSESSPLSPTPSPPSTSPVLPALPPPKSVTSPSAPSSKGMKPTTSLNPKIIF
jgi:Salt stress response/antifungal